MSEDDVVGEDGEAAEREHETPRIGMVKLKRLKKLQRMQDEVARLMSGVSTTSGVAAAACRKQGRGRVES